MCDHDNREAAMTVIRRNKEGTPTVWCDPCIAPVITALNDGGIPTAASCCGHNGRGSDRERTNAPGWVMLQDGRVLGIYPDQAQMFAAQEPVSDLAAAAAALADEYGSQSTPGVWSTALHPREVSDRLRSLLTNEGLK